MKALLYTLMAAGLLLSVTSCRGRTTKDVEPDGTTVDVVIPESLPDSLR